MKRRYRTVSVLSVLIEEISDFIKETKIWNSVSDFVHEALRTKLQYEKFKTTGYTIAPAKETT